MGLEKKGRPSDDRKEGLGLRPTMKPEDLEADLRMTEKYTRGEDELAPGVPVRHHNRNTEKDDERQKKESNRYTGERFNEDVPATAPTELPGIMYKQLIAYLSNYTSDCCSTIFIPTHIPGVEGTEQNDILTFKNQLQQVKQTLEEKGMDPLRIEKILEPAIDFLSERPFRYDLKKGMAVFMSDGVFHYARLFIRPMQEIYINNSFYLAPLVPAMTTPEHFYILTISKKKARFLRADAFGIEEIPIDDMPNGVDDVVHLEEKDDGDVFRLGSRGYKVANYHGIGGAEPDEKTNIALYLKDVDRTVMKFALAQEQSPLLLAGIEYEVAIYRQVSQYNFIAPEVLTGNYDQERAELIYEKAKEIMAYYFEERLRKAIDAYMNNSARPLTSSIPDDVIPASYYGRVENLFVRKGEHLWGRFNEQDNELHLHDTKMEGDECLLDKAVIRTILNGGQAFILEKDKMPVPGIMAALFRY